MAIKLQDCKFVFINDTKQGPLLQYRRSQGPLEVGETIQIVGEYVHFTVKDSNFLKTGDESNADSDYGTGFIELIIGPAQTEIYSIRWLTYYTNGAFKEVLMRIAPVAYTHIESWNA